VAGIGAGGEASDKKKREESGENAGFRHVAAPVVPGEGTRQGGGRFGVPITVSTRVSIRVIGATLAPEWALASKARYLSRRLVGSTVAIILAVIAVQLIMLRGR
jgi:hypothetical protein